MFDILAVVVILSFFAWASWCVNQTRSDRESVISTIHEEGLAAIVRGDYDIFDKWEVFDRVSFDKHFWYRITFRDWRRLYNTV